MKKLINYIFLFCIFVNFEVSAIENFFEEAKKKYNQKKIEDSKFLFQRNIVFNPKHANSYLYLAKIYNFEKNEIEEIKNLKTTLLLDPGNEEAMYMLIQVKLEKSNFSEVKKLKEQFKIICLKLCSKTKDINKKLKDIEAKNES